jgi:hypothetical protein
MKKRNAALEMLQGAGFEPVQEPPQALESNENVVVITPKKQRSRGVRRVMVYMPVKVARKFREIAFTEDRKANEVYLEALDLYLTKQGHGGIKGVVER